MTIKPKRGRPKRPEPGSRVSAWLRAGDHDRLVRDAVKADTTVSAIVRDLVRQHVTRRDF